MFFLSNVLSIHIKLKIVFYNLLENIPNILVYCVLYCFLQKNYNIFLFHKKNLYKTIDKILK